jgi:hypothetical protein
MSEDVLKLLSARAAAMAEHDGVAVAVVHIFGASNDIVADVGTARDALIGKPGLLADMLSDMADAATVDLADIDPVTEARRLADEAIATALAAAERADQLTAEADRLQAEKDAADKEAADKAAADQAEADRLAAEKAAADQAEADRLAAEKAAADQAEANRLQAEKDAADKEAAEKAAGETTVQGKKRR